MGYGKGPDHRAYQRYFNKFSQAANQRVFNSLYSWFFSELCFDNYTLDFDSTVMERCGEQEGAALGYKYVERLAPVVDPNGNALGTVMLRFYNDMPNVPYINVSHFLEMIYPALPFMLCPLTMVSLCNPFEMAKVDKLIEQFYAK